MNKSKSSTSWQNASKWYNDLVSEKGHYYHQKIIIPKIMKLFNLQQNSSILDLGCGQGVLEKNIPNEIYYQGIDASNNLIKYAQKQKISSLHHFQTADITKPLPISKFGFTHSAIILAIQNTENPEKVFANVHKYLVLSGKLFIVLNHPCFRIPRNSNWGIDIENKIQYRKINKYLSRIKIPILVNPGLKEKSPVIPTFHYSISQLAEFLYKTGFVITNIEEWISDKVSIGKNAEMENIARQEFPLFMCLVCQKI